MKKILAFAGSNSSTSINQQLINAIAPTVAGAAIQVIKLTDYNIPMYGIDAEQAGFPADLQQLNDLIQAADGLIISVAEHNGNVTAFFKSIQDWLSRFNRTFLEGKKILLLSTSPGGRGGAGALEITKKTLPYFKGEIVATQSIGKFNEVVKDGKIQDSTVAALVNTNVQQLIDSLGA